MRWTRWTLIVSLGWLLLSSAPARAADRVWVGGSGNWTDNFHWDPFGVPVGGDRVFATAADSLHKIITFNDTRQIIPIYNSLLIAEGIAQAQKLTGKKAVTGEDVRRGMENIKLDPARLKELGLEGFTDQLALSCADHNGHRAAFMQEWDGTKWVKISNPIEPMTDRVKGQLDAAAKDYAEKNAGWPKRTEACDKAS